MPIQNKNLKRNPRSDEVKRAISLANSGSGNGMWRGGKSTAICRKCGKEFLFYPRTSKGMFCSTKCSNVVQAKNPTWLWTDEAIHNSSVAHKKLYEDEEKHPRWKGDGVGYVSLHKWVRKHLGESKICAVCGTDDEDKTYNWANLSGRYIRDLSDWKRMCLSCHRKYDYGRNKK